MCACTTSLVISVFYFQCLFLSAMVSVIVIKVCFMHSALDNFKMIWHFKIWSNNIIIILQQHLSIILCLD